jgi:flagellar basal body P-ring protein FlgI
MTENMAKNNMYIGVGIVSVTREYPNTPQSGKFNENIQSSSGTALNRNGGILYVTTIRTHTKNMYADIDGIKNRSGIYAPKNK